MTELHSFADVSSDLLRTIADALPVLRAIGDEKAERPLAPGKWSAKQVIGHLTDSAANNHQRFVRAQDGPLSFPGYAQDDWVARQGYQARAWRDLVELWHAYNWHLAHVIARIPDDKRGVACAIGGNAPVTLVWLVEDYVVHLRHHLAQVTAPAR